MTDTSAARSAVGGPWTCPFCPLACDHLAAWPDPVEQSLTLQGGDCPRASAALATFPDVPSLAVPRRDGEPCTLDAAIDAAARLLAASRQPLFGGLGTDVAGARALYPLACATGAISDAAAGEALMHGLRALQDRGQYTTTLAEVRTRADLIVFVGGLPVDIAPLIVQRCGIGDAQVPQRGVVLLGPREGDAARLAEWAGRDGVTIESIAIERDLFTTLGLLSALVNGRPLPHAPDSLHRLAEALGAARYSVL
ncbi:MAG: formylmethanofuran dehydrogenase, partial [Caldimonas sp.]